MTGSRQVPRKEEVEIWDYHGREVVDGGLYIFNLPPIEDFIWGQIEHSDTNIDNFMPRRFQAWKSSENLVLRVSNYPVWCVGHSTLLR